MARVAHADPGRQQIYTAILSLEEGVKGSRTRSRSREAVLFDVEKLFEDG
jgi:hypothetical protein